MTPSKPPPPIARKSSGPAWAASSSTFAPPNAAPGPSSPDTRSFSLLAIQQAEIDFAGKSVKQPAKSLVQIQEEERKAQVARADEAEFMRWWQEEEARMKKATPDVQGGGRGGRGGGRGGS